MQFTTSEITEGLDLLGDFLDAKGYTEEAGLCTKAMDEINALRADNERIKEEYGPALDTLVLFDQVCADNALLRQALHDIYEIYAGSEGTAGMKHPELYLQGCVQEMAYIAGKHKRVGGENDDYAR